MLNSVTRLKIMGKLVDNICSRCVASRDSTELRHHFGLKKYIN